MLMYCRKRCRASKRRHKIDVSYSLQEEQLGTGYAVKCAKSFLEGRCGCKFVGDAPLT